jgi:hypothetical protein
VSVWVKSATPGTPYNGTLRLAGRTSSLDEGAEQSFTATDEWTKVSVKLTTSLVGLTTLRTTLSLDSDGAALLVDGFELH